MKHRPNNQPKFLAHFPLLDQVLIRDSIFLKTGFFLAVIALPGCHLVRYNRINLTDYPANQMPALHFEDFPEAYFRYDEIGQIDVVLRNQSHGQDGRKIEQIIHIRSMWTPRPGRTFADESIINAQINYFIVKPASSISYEGGGYCQYKVNRSRAQVTGKVEGAQLYPNRKTGLGINIFERAEISGRFKANRDDLRTSRMINRLNRRLGPRPRDEQSIGGPDY